MNIVYPILSIILSTYVIRPYLCERQ